MPSKGYSYSVIGSREMNQDSFLILEEKELYAVADGVGGGLKGEVASKMAVDGLQGFPSTEKSFVPTIEKIQEAILKEAYETLGEPVMGTTLTAVRLVGAEALMGHVGDSHLYHYSDSHLKLLTVDHELFDETMGGTVLASYLGIESEEHPLQIQEDRFTVKAGDKLLLCTDGLYRQLTDHRIAHLIQQHQKDPKALVTALCAEASSAQYSDNVTVVFVEVL